MLFRDNKETMCVKVVEQYFCTEQPQAKCDYSFTAVYETKQLL